MPGTDSSLDIIFLGTGSSSGSPYPACIMKTPRLGDPKAEGACKTCLSTLDEHGMVKSEHPNVRGCPSAIVRKRWDDGRESTILIDCGPSFRSACVKYFRSNGIDRLDGVLLTHEHADAILGINDVGSLAKGKQGVQDYVDVYCSSATFERIAAAFPWLIPGKSITGSGEIGSIRWHIIKAYAPVTIAGIEILPLSVQHGTSQVPRPHNPSVPPSAPVAGISAQAFTPPTTPDRERFQVPDLPGAASEMITVPYMVFSFLIEGEIFYASDMNDMPAETWKMLGWSKTGTKPGFDQLLGIGPACYPTEVALGLSNHIHQLPLLILDVDDWVIHRSKSHLSVAESFQMAQTIGAKATYMTGITHLIEHDGMAALCGMIDGERAAEELGAEGRKWVEEHSKQRRELKQAKPHIRPARDGLRLTIRNGQVVAY